jgi:hypothetical protein
MDDIPIFGTNMKVIHEVNSFLSKSFDMKDLGQADVILNIKLIKNESEITLSQSHYVEKILSRFGFIDGKSSPTPYDPSVILRKNKNGPTDQLKQYHESKPWVCVYSVKCSVFLCSEKISSAPRLNFANRGARVVTFRVETSEEEEESACGTFSHSLTKWCNTPRYMWSTSLPTFHMGLNLALTSCLCAANNLGCMSHWLTNMGFEISRNF